MALLKVAGVIYYLLSLGAAQITYILVYGPAFWTVSNGAVGSFHAM